MYPSLTPGMLAAIRANGSVRKHLEDSPFSEIVRNGSEHINAGRKVVVATLRGLKTCLVYSYEVDKELEILERGTVDENFRRLEGGHIDYFITSQFAGVASLRARQGGSKITYLKPPITEEGLYFGFSKKSPCAALLAQFDQRLSVLAKKDALRAILNKHLDEAQQ